MWRRHGGNVAAVDLRHAYLQIHLNRRRDDQAFSDSTYWSPALVSHVAWFRSAYDFAGDEDGESSGDEDCDPSDLGARPECGSDRASLRS